MFQNTQVTRGTATFVVTGAGRATQMGQIAGMVTATRRSKSALQRELDGMATVSGTIAFAAAAVIAVFGPVRGMDTTTLVLLCIFTAIASIPAGLPAFVQAMPSSGARRLAGAKAVVKSLPDVETLGGATVINSGRTGALTMNAILGVGGGELPGFRNLALGLVLCTDAAAGDDGPVIGDPTEAAFVVLAAKMGAGAAQTREAMPRRAEVPFDSGYTFMATFHDRPDWLAASRKLSGRGLPVLAFAAKDLGAAAMAAALAGPMAAVTDLVFIAPA